MPSTLVKIVVCIAATNEMPSVGVDIATRESKQQRNLHRFIAAYRRTGGNIQRTHVKTQAVAGPVRLDNRRPRAWRGLIWIKLSASSRESNRCTIELPRPGER